jgi:hypothetical protein
LYLWTASGVHHEARECGNPSAVLAGWRLDNTIATGDVSGTITRAEMQNMHLHAEFA